MPTQKSDLDFAADLFKAADKLRGNLEPSENKHVALGLIFLKYISEAFNIVHEKLKADEYADEEDPEEYLAENVFWVPKEARWRYLQDNAKRPEIEIEGGKKVDIGGLLDRAMDAIEKVPTNETLKGVLPKNYARPTLNKQMLGELIDLFSNIKLHDDNERARDLLGRVDVPPDFRSVLSWNFPLIIPVMGEGEFHEEVEVLGGADRVHLAPGGGRNAGG